MAATLIHISDLHFHRIPRKPSQWFSKRAFGALNLVFNRRRLYPLARAERLVRQLERMDWQHLVLTGDVTQLALEEEFDLARRTLQPLLERGPGQVTILPGNHDRYVRQRPGADLFGAYFGEFFGPDEIATRALTARWHLVGWDSAQPTGPLDATGFVRPETLRATERWLEGLAPDARVIVANHYPLYFPPPHRFQRSHDLRNLEPVQEWMRTRAIDLYLHGHRHWNWVLHVGDRVRPLTIVNSASTTRTPHPGEPSDFHRIELGAEGAQVVPLRLD